MSFAYIGNTSWMAASFREAHAFQRDTKRVRETQAALLLRILRRNRNTWIGRKYRFDCLDSVQAFQEHLPLSNYDDYRSAIQRISDGQQNVLTSDRVRILEPTGGSISGEKLVPYTAWLQQAFRRAIRVWIWDLFSSRPQVRPGSSYWSISPLTHVGRRTSAGIPIGFDNDAAYLSGWEQMLVRRTMAVPPEVALCPSIETAQYATLFFLLRDPSLAFISIWSPTFLTELLKVLWSRWESLCDDLATGRISANSPDEHSPVTQRRYRPQAKRAAYVRQILRAADHVSQCMPDLFSSLALVSCWADGPSQMQANNLKQYLPGIELQPKGLLATEAFVTVPLMSCAAPALAIRSHFFEFRPANTTPGSTSRPLLAHELREGERYSVIVTNGGGLYRYQLQDEVEVVGFKFENPLLRFIGRTDDTCDLVGEKLHASHVEWVLQTVYRHLQLTPTFAQLRADSLSSPGYLLQISVPSQQESPQVQERLRQSVESGLEANPAYKYARDLGQLRPLRVKLLSQHEADAISSKRTADLVAAGQRLGDVKPATLYAPAWEETLRRPTPLPEIHSQTELEPKP